MIIYTFVATTNFFCKARHTDARYVSTRRAFFMPIRQVIDSIYNLLSAACLRWYLSYPHFNFLPCKELVVGGEEGSRFYCPRLTTNSIMSKKTTTELLTVQITPAQMRFLDLCLHLDAYDRVKDLNNIIYNAVGSDTTDDESMRQMLLLSDAMMDIAFEHKA